MAGRRKYALQAAFTDVSLQLFTLLDMAGVDDEVQAHVGDLLAGIVRRHLAAAEVDSPDEQPLIDLLERLEGDCGLCHEEGETRT